MRKKQFPQTIYVVRCKDDPDLLIITSEDLENVDHDEVVGVYEFQYSAKAKVTRILVGGKP